MHKILVVDDITEEPADRTVCFGLGKKWYEIDLTEDHARELEDLIGFYIPYSRPQGTTPKTVRQTASSQPAPDTGDDWWVTKPSDSKAVAEQKSHLRNRIRTWGDTHGFPLGDKRGRISRALAARWQAAHADEDETVSRHRTSEPDDIDDVDTDTGEPAEPDDRDDGGTVLFREPHKPVKRITGRRPAAKVAAS